VSLLVGALCGVAGLERRSLAIESLQYSATNSACFAVKVIAGLVRLAIYITASVPSARYLGANTPNRMSERKRRIEPASRNARDEPVK
jgi:hypothetical protein